MRHTTLSLIILLFVFLTSADLSASTPARQWTVIGWFSADDEHDVTIEEAQYENLKEFARTGCGKGFDVVVQADRGKKASGWLRDRVEDADYRGATRYHLERGKPVAVERVGEVNMGDPGELRKFLEWAAERYPARRYLVIFNSHGSGTLSWSGPGSTDRPAPRYVSYDDTSDDCLTIREMADVLQQFTHGRGGKRVELVVFDSCMAATVEALYELRDGVELLAGSESLMPGEGLGYRALGAALRRDPAISPAALASAITDTFIARVEAGNVYGAFRTDASEELAAACSRLARELSLGGKDAATSVARARLKMDNHGWDLESIARAAASGAGRVDSASNAAAIRSAGAKAVRALEQSRVALRRSGKLARSDAGGLSIQWPNGEDYRDLRRFYKSTAFAKATLWDEFLDWRELGMEAR